GGDPSARQVTARGAIDGSWTTADGIDVLRAGAIASGFEADLGGALGRLTTSGDASGRITAARFGSARVGGDLSGADWSAGGQAVTPSALDALNAIPADLANSAARGGIQVIDADRSFGRIHIRGTADDDSRISAGDFLSRILVDGKRVDPAQDDRFEIL
ncbi:MAG: hypothetical protein CMJ18_26175, partial [Phycisphaeraceae bacterium]|nr:hypothetical protein [Phycisphaeraceae bacterium]